MAPGPSPTEAPDSPPTGIPVPETDAFGPTARDGDLPAVFQNMSLDADVLYLGPPMRDGGRAFRRRAAGAASAARTR